MENNMNFANTYDYRIDGIGMVEMREVVNTKQTNVLKDGKIIGSVDAYWWDLDSIRTELKKTAPQMKANMLTNQTKGIAGSLASLRSQVHHITDETARGRMMSYIDAMERQIADLKNQSK